MLTSQAHSFAQQSRLAITLAWVAGYTNIVSVLACGIVVSHVTGAASSFGLHAVRSEWHDVAFLLWLLATFFTGAGLSAVLTETGRRRAWESIYVLPMACEALLLSIFAVGIELHDPEATARGPALWILTGAASAAMGLQNATITSISRGVVRTTHLTGVLTDLGSECARFLIRRPHTAASPDPDRPSAARALLLFSIVASFMLGAFLGGLAFQFFPRWSMMLPVAFLLWIIWQDITAPICEIDSSHNTEAGRAMGLPDSIAVYHVRKSTRKKRRRHRLPDLARWFGRLPHATRVVILDLGDSPEMSDVAAAEIRALLELSRTHGRRLVLAGITPDQYQALRQYGGTAIDPHNICTDLELAIARGLTMLHDPHRR